MLARLTKTLSTNAAILGTIALVIGASGSSVAYFTASDEPSPAGPTQAEQGDAEHDADADADKPEHDANADSDADEQGGQADAQDTGVRPTDAHGYCVSQLAQSSSTDRTGTGSSAVTHGSLVSAAAHACGKTTAADKAARAAARSAPAGKTHGKGFGRHHGTGRPAAVTAGH